MTEAGAALRDLLRACADDARLTERARGLALAASMEDAAVGAECIPLLLELEQAEKAAKDTDAALRRALLAHFEAARVPGAVDATHELRVVTTKPAPVVTDPKALPPEFLKPRDPAPDMDAIKKAWKAGALPAGVTLSNGGAHLRLAPKG